MAPMTLRAWRAKARNGNWKWEIMTNKEECEHRPGAAIVAESNRDHRSFIDK